MVCSCGNGASLRLHLSFSKRTQKHEPKTVMTGARPDLSMAMLREVAPVRTPERAGVKAAAEATRAAKATVRISIGIVDVLAYALVFIGREDLAEGKKVTSF